MVNIAATNATTLTVTTTTDSGAGSLRNAITAAGDGDTIQFDTALSGQTITLTSAELVIDKNITISGLGPTLLAVSRASNATNFRIFHVMPGHTVMIEGLTISAGHGDGYGFNFARVVLPRSLGYAGGIPNFGTLEISNSIISDNVADFSSGGIRKFGMLTITDSTVTDNHAGSGLLSGYVVGGGIDSSGTLLERRSFLGRAFEISPATTKLTGTT